MKPTNKMFDKMIDESFRNLIYIVELSSSKATWVKKKQVIFHPCNQWHDFKVSYEFTLLLVRQNYKYGQGQDHEMFSIYHEPFEGLLLSSTKLNFVGSTIDWSWIKGCWSSCSAVGRAVGSLCKQSFMKFWASFERLLGISGKPLLFAILNIAATWFKNNINKI